MNNIQVVDSIVRETEKLFWDFYGDEETSFVFTADYGMSKIGNHGDGGEPACTLVKTIFPAFSDPDNTRTPLIAWGKGIRGPLPDSSPSSHDDFSRQWQLEHILRRDVSQADIAPLMASLVGIDWPHRTLIPTGNRYIECNMTTSCCLHHHTLFHSTQRHWGTTTQ